jgi:hypothetical protein
LGCFFAHLSYSPRTAGLASSFFMLAMRTSSWWEACSVRCDYRVVLRAP